MTNRATTEITLAIHSAAGGFAEDKDVAASIREEKIRPALDSGMHVVLDFAGVRIATQSFIHAAISEVLRSHGESVLRRLTFKGCSKAVKGIIETVVQYSLESLEEPQYGPSAAGAAAPPKPRRRKKKKK